MPPKKKGKKGRKGKKKKEPKHDAGWQKALINGKWERPLEALPDPFLWPSFGEIREHILLACHLISIAWSGSMHDDFILELFRVPRPNLVTLELRGTKYITRFVMSPPSVCPLLETLDLSCCPNLEYALIESMSIRSLSFARCVSLRKALLQVRKLRELNLQETKSLDCFMLWSDAIEELVFSNKNMSQLELCCPKLVTVQRPSLKVIPTVYPVHPAVLDIVRVDNAPKAREYHPPCVTEEFRPYAMKAALSGVSPAAIGASRLRRMSGTTQPDNNPNPDHKTVNVKIKGKVQGVFYRDWTVEIAKQMGLNGWVRNRRDGSVEALFSGKSDTVDAMVRKCHQGPPAARVTAVEALAWTGSVPEGFQRKTSE